MEMKESLMPPSRPSDHEYAMWQTIPNDLERRVFYSFEEVQKELTKLLRTEKNRIFYTIKKFSEGKNYTIYGLYIKYKQEGKREISFTKKVAYRCHNCNKYVLGMPRIEDDNSIEIGIPLAGRSGFDAYCNSCGSHLYENIHKKES